MLHRTTQRRGRSSSPRATWRLGFVQIGLVVLAVVSLVGIAAAGSDDVLLIEGHTFEYLGVTYNADGTSTWTYRVSSADQPSLSHWTLEWDAHLDASNVVEASERFEVGTDPRTDLYGIKFDEGYCSGKPKSNERDATDESARPSTCETRLVSFTLDAWYEVVATRIGVKAGQQVAIEGTIPGPSAEWTPGNGAPIAVDDEAQTYEAKSVVISVLENDSDPDGDPLTIRSIDEPQNGEASQSGKKVKYTPSEGFVGVDRFSYTISDPSGDTATAWVTVAVGHENDAPIAADDEASTDENEPVVIAVLANDSDPDGSIDPASVVVTAAPERGTLDVHRKTGEATYVPDPGTCGVDAFQYVVSDNEGATSDAATVRISVICNQPPTAVDDRVDTEVDTPVILDVAANDRDADGTVRANTIAIRSTPRQGDASVDPTTGLVTYTPDRGACGDDSFRYTIEDDDGAESNEATVDVAIRCNEPPTANDDRAATDENTSIGIDAAANDVDADGSIDRKTVTVTAPPRGGTTSVHPRTGLITYTPDPGTCGDDAFEYTVDDNDGATSNAATITVRVLCNDPPLAIDDLYTVAEGGTLEVDPPGVLDNDVDTPGSPLVAIMVSDVDHGRLTLKRDGSFVYVHDGTETFDDEFTYIANDGAKDSNVASVSLVITPRNDAPAAEDDRATTEEDAPVTIDVLANDSDPDGDALSVDWVGRANDGTVLNNGGSVTYRPDPDFHGTDSFSYTVSDGSGGTAKATVVVTVEPVNDPPIAANDSASTAEDEPVSILVLENDADPDGDRLSIIEVSQPANGWVDNGRTDVTYTPDPDFHGVDAFTYTVFDEHGGTASATVTVTVEPINDPPVARDDEATTAEDAPVTIDVLANDVDPEADPLTVESVGRPANGFATSDGARVTYTPDPDFHGVDAFRYVVSDGNGGTDEATVTVTVLPTNDPPIAQDDSETTREDQSVTIDVLANDTDPEEDALTVESVDRPGNGSAAVSGRDVLYTPDPDFYGVDRFEYVVSDGNGGTAAATVTVTVVAVNDPPIARDDRASTPEETPTIVEVLANDEDPEGESLTVESVTRPSDGSVSNEGSHVIYTPDADFFGTDTFTYVVADGGGETATAVVTITVVSVNDPPVAQDDSAVTEEETMVTIDALRNDSDPDGDFLLIASVERPSNGSVINAETNVSYVPDPGFNGVDAFRYTVSDSNGGSSTATITVSVAAVNDPPVAQDDSGSTEEEVAITLDVLANDEDPDGDELTIQAVTQPEHGSVVNGGLDVTYAPAPDFHGVDQFTYIASDGNGGTDQATVTVAVGGVNDPPIAQDDRESTDEDTSVRIDVLGNDDDPDGDRLMVESVTQPANGSVVNGGSDVTYVPAPDFSGSDAFTYVVADGHGGTDEATVTVVVTPENDPPVAVDDRADTDEDTAVTIDVLANDTDPEEDALVVESVSRPAHGTATNHGENVTYTPDPGFHGVDGFGYVIADGNGGTAAATVTVAVATVNDPPTARDDSQSTRENVSVDIDVLANDDDPEGDTLTVESVSAPANGSVVNRGDSVTYVPDPGFDGDDRFTYVVSDGNGGTDQATVRVTVAAVNDAPIAQDDAATTVEGLPISIAVASNDVDPDGDALTVESATRPAHGAVAPSGASVVYTPSPGFSGTDRFRYTISDGHGGTASATVTVTVLATNDPPVAQDDSVTASGGSLTIPILDNDSDPDGDELVVESLTQPSHGVAVNNGIDVTYIPDPGFHGTDTFTYTVSDRNGETDTATVIVSVSSENSPPIAQDDSATTEEGTLVSVAVLANDRDPDGDFLLVESFTDPAHGSVLNARTGVSYVPDPGFEGVDTFRYTVSDGNGGTATATVTVAVAGVNDPPEAADDNAVTDEGSSVTIFVLLNDFDPDGDVLIVESVATAEHGQAVNNGDDVTYTPDPGFSGVDAFRYTVSDGQGGTATATVFVAVAPVNDPPIAQDDSATTERDAPVTVSVLSNDSDPDGDALFIESITQPSHGTATIDGVGIVYTPEPGYSGTDRMTYVVSDGRGNADTAMVTIGVSGDAGGGGAAERTACDGRVIIHEVAWAGTAADSKDEWIELRNLGTTPVDLDGWELRWRRSHPSTPEEQVWKVVELAGVLGPSSGRTCDPAQVATEPAIRFFRDDPDDVAWFLSSEADDADTGFYVLERRHDDVIGDAPADLLYDTGRALSLELSDRGEVLMLVNELGEIVDTANASNLGRDGWAAGSATTFGTMERIDPLAADTADNWHTNAGIVTHGEDANGNLLRATPGRLNSPVLEELDAYAKIDPMTVRAGAIVSVDFLLPRRDRRTTGWPWISVSRPGFVGAAGAGGTVDVAGYSFSGRYDGGERYVLDIGTENLPPGTYVFWVIYGQGQAALVPILVAR